VGAAEAAITAADSAVRSSQANLQRLLELKGFCHVTAPFAGVITAPLVAVAPEMGGLVLIECFIVTVVGGMGSFLGAVAGGLLIGETLALTGMLYDVLADVIIYLAMALVLLVRPRGLFGQEGMSEE